MKPLHRALLLRTPARAALCRALGLALAASALLLGACAAPRDGGVPAAGPALATVAAAGATEPARAPVAVTGLAWQAVSIDGPQGVRLRGHFLPAPATARQPAPAVLALHGCGGLYTASGALSSRYLEAAAQLQAAGAAVLLVDSFGSRQIERVCQTRYAERRIDVADRVGDTQAALSWLGARPGVDAQRLALMGWSNGGTTVLHVLAALRERPAGVPMPAAAAVWYPGCVPLARERTAVAAVPLLMQLGALDDWTPPAPCEAWARQVQQQGTPIEWHVHADSYHGFDGTAPVRFRADVPNGVNGRGVHQGSHAPARAASQRLLDAFWARTLGLSPAEGRL